MTVCVATDYGARSRASYGGVTGADRDARMRRRWRRCCAGWRCAWTPRTPTPLEASRNIRAACARTGCPIAGWGAKELGAFAALEAQRLYARVLPSHEGIAACEAAGIPHRNIIAMQGPFSRS